MSCGVGHRPGSDPGLLWLLCRLAAVALIGSLAWEPPCAIGTALKSKKKTRTNQPTKQANKKTNQPTKQTKVLLGDRDLKSQTEGMPLVIQPHASR